MDSLDRTVCVKKLQFALIIATFGKGSILSHFGMHACFCLCYFEKVTVRNLSWTTDMRDL